MLKRLRFGFFLGLIILVIDAAIPLVLDKKATDLREAASAATAASGRLDKLLSAYKDAETGQRGFMLAGREEFLDPYHYGRNEIESLLPQLQKDLAGDAEQNQRFQTLLKLDAEELEFQQRRIGLRRQNESFFDPAGALRGKTLMDALRKQIADMREHEQRHASAHLAAVERIHALSRRSIVVITALDLLLMAVVFWLAYRAMRTAHTARRALSESNTNLSNQIALRNAAVANLEQQARQLNQIIAMQSALAESQLDVEKFTQQITENILQVTQASGAAIEMLEGDAMCYRAVSGSLGNFLGMRLPRDGSLSGLCVTKAELLIAADTRNDPRVDRAACEKVGALSMIAAPLLRAGEAVGVLKIVGTVPDVFDTGDVQTLQLMAGFLGAALGHQLQFDRYQTLLVERSLALTSLERELQRRDEYEQRLLSQRQRTETIIESSHEAFICMDSNGVICEWNAMAAATFGWSKHDALGKLVDELIIPPPYRDAHRQGIAHFLRTGEGPVISKRIELPALCRDGSEIPIELTISVLRDGDRVEFPCFLRDISERKHAEAQLLNQQKTLRAVTDAIPAFVAFVDSDQYYRYCNKQYEVAFGIKPEAIVNRSVRDLFGEEAYAVIKNQVERSLAGEFLTYERTLPTTKGLRDQECRHVPQFDAVDNVTGFYLIAWDITERKTQEVEWQSRALTDPLTRLPNRTFFLDALNVVLQRQNAADNSVAVFYLDVDHFKQINDVHGHVCGDLVLKFFADCLRQSVRQSDVIGRMGGDEFCIVLDNIQSAKNAAAIAEKILTAVRTPAPIGTTVLTISTSIGIAYSSGKGFDGEAMIAGADAALYKAKQAGRGRFALDEMAAR